MLQLENIDTSWGDIEKRKRILNSYNDFYFPEKISLFSYNDCADSTPVFNIVGDSKTVMKLDKASFLGGFYRLIVAFKILKSKSSQEESFSNDYLYEGYIEARVMMLLSDLRLCLPKKYLLLFKNVVDSESISNEEEIKKTQLQRVVLEEINNALECKNINIDTILYRNLINNFFQNLNAQELTEIVSFNLQRYLNQINLFKLGESVYKKNDDLICELEDKDFYLSDVNIGNILSFPKHKILVELVDYLNLNEQDKGFISLFLNNAYFKIISSNEPSIGLIKDIVALFGEKETEGSVTILNMLGLIKKDMSVYLPVFYKGVQLNLLDELVSTINVKIFNSLDKAKELILSGVKEEDLSNLTLSNYSYLSKELNELMMILKNGGHKNILIWGPPGFGKTELVKVLAKENSKKIININTVIIKKNGKAEATDKDMFKRLLIAKDVAKAINNQWVIVDEAENILKDASLKGMFNSEIDKKDVTTFWVLNDLQGIHASYIRRFDYILELSEMPFTERENLARSLLKENNRDGFSIKLAHSLKTPAEIVGAIENCKDIGVYDWRLVAKKMSAYQKVLSKSATGDEGGFEIEVKIPEVGKGLKDFAGYDYIKQEILDNFDIFNDTEKYKKNGAKLPKGLLLMGNPGVGKTLLTKAIANEYQLTLVTAKSTELAAKPERIKHLFDKAKSLAPCILFIDELDVLGSNVVNPDGSIDTGKQTILNSLLVEMDGFDKFEGILTIGATHRSNLLDKTLLRNGRFGLKLRLRNPEKKDRVEIFKFYLKDKQYEDINFESIAKISQGFSSVDIAESVNLALLKSLKSGVNLITHNFLVDAIDEIFFGVKSNGLPMNNKEKFLTAIHESGHALVSMKNKIPVKRATIRPHENFLGMVQTERDEEVWSSNNEDVLKMIEVYIAGMLSEKLIFGKFSNGNTSDLKATRMTLFNFYINSGASKTLGILGFEPAMISEDKKKKLEDEFIDILNSKEKEVTEWLAENKNKLIDFAKLLLEKRSLDFEEIKKWQNHNLKEIDLKDENESIDALIDMAYNSVTVP